eukprot:gnl/MRDRNA2_/MRDRNA2_123141_c0_seq1.p1 gnl/MRDRNA2_/MRDRNA2_123141_c0~~gnl/MRDRNA2_/MRDRNA2_123141_c0_seq1.p1  ORF type:complete len:290 (+),score=66.86 gnl/MRDRNA2_/MRDRNA2_123141_c0_seq1:101-970(+)
MVRFFSFVAFAVGAHCVNAAAPFPNGVIPALEQIVCHVAENKTLESFAVHNVCEEVSKYYPSGNATCEADLTKVWGSFAQQCKDMDHLADWVQEEFCKVSGSAALEAEVVAVSCGIVHYADPGIPSFVCRRAMQKTWSLLASECPKVVVGMPELGLFVGDIEKLICGVMENKTLERQASQKVCHYAQQVTPSANITLCVAEVERLWGSFESDCKDVASLATWIRDEFCHNAKNSMMESEFAAVACGLAHYAAPQVPSVVCKTAVQEAWLALASECPALVAEPVQGPILV